MTPLPQKIIDVLKDSDMTISEISLKTRLHRITASKYLAVMEAEGFVKCRHIGKAKLYSLNIRKVGGIVGG